MARLTRADFALFSSPGVRREHGRFFLLLVAPLPVGGPPKAACVVSKQIFRKASDRNKLKRRARTALRAALPAKFPFALAFHAKKAARDAAYADIVEDIRALVAKVSTR